MKKVLLTLFFLLIITGCSGVVNDTSFEIAEPIKVEPIALIEEIGDLMLSLRLDKNSYNHNDTIVVTASLINNGDSTYRYQTGSTCNTVPDVDFGKDIFRYYKTPKGLFGPCGEAITDWKIAPGESSERKFVLEPKTYVKEKAFYKGDDLTIATSYDGKELTTKLTFDDIPMFDEVAPFPRNKDEAKKLAKSLEITQEWMEEHGFQKNNLRVEDNGLSDDTWHIQIYEDDKKRMLSIGIDEHNGNITYATDYDLKEPYNNNFKKIIEKPKTTKEIAYLIKHGPKRELKVRVSFTENVKSMPEIIEKHNGVIVSFIESIHVATVKIEASDIKKLIEEDTVDYVKGNE